MVRGGLSLIVVLVLAWFFQTYRAWQAAESDGNDYLPIRTALTATYGVELENRGVSGSFEGNRFYLDLEVQPRGEGALYVETWRRNLEATEGGDVLHVRSGEVKVREDGIADAAGKQLIVPMLHRDKPRSWKVVLEGETPLWPLLTWLPDETAVPGSPGIAWNPIDREEIQFFQQPPERLDWGQGSVECFRVHYLGHRSRPGSFHRLEGRLWLAPGIGVAREERTVRHEVHEKGQPALVHETRMVRELIRSKDRS